MSSALFPLASKAQGNLQMAYHCVVSLAAIFSLAPPQKQLLTFEKHVLCVTRLKTAARETNYCVVACIASVLCVFRKRKTQKSIEISKQTSFGRTKNGESTKLIRLPISMDFWVFLSLKKHRNACYTG